MGVVGWSAWCWIGLFALQLVCAVAWLVGEPVGCLASCLSWVDFDWLAGTFSINSIVFTCLRCVCLGVVLFCALLRCNRADAVWCVPWNTEPYRVCWWPCFLRTTHEYTVWSVQQLVLFFALHGRALRFWLVLVLLVVLWCGWYRSVWYRCENKNNTEPAL